MGIKASTNGDVFGNKFVIGTNITLKPQQVVISTVARVGSGTTVTLSTTTSDMDIVTFIHYNGSTNTEANNYKTFATKNGGFRFG